MHVFNVNDADPEARKGMLVRDYEREHVDAIKARMIRNPVAMVLPWAVVIVGLKKPEDFEMEKVYNHEYTFIPIGGLHSWRPSLNAEMRTVASPRLPTRNSNTATR